MRDQGGGDPIRTQEVLKRRLQRNRTTTIPIARDGPRDSPGIAACHAVVLRAPIDTIIDTRAAGPWEVRRVPRQDHCARQA